MFILKRIYGASFIFSLALALSAYVNSSFLSEHVGNDFVGVVYALAAFGTLISLELLPRTIEKIGNRNTILFLILLNIIGLISLVGSNNFRIVTSAFILFYVSNSLIWYCLDLFIEHYSSESKVGRIRGFYLSLTNLAWLFSPVMAGYIVNNFGFPSLYAVIAGFTTIVCVILHFSLTKYHDKKYRRLSMSAAIKSILKRPSLSHITVINFILQFFYAWMVVYTPLYLHEVHKIPFTTIGVMFTVMLIPFVILQYPIGRLLDVFHHERIFLLTGILIMSGSTFIFGYSLFGGNILMLTATLFTTRVGASIIEVVTESYFFKRVTDADAEIISLFRSTLPLAYLFAPLFATVFLSHYSYNGLFMTLGILILISIFPLNHLTNSRE